MAIFRTHLPFFDGEPAAGGAAPPAPAAPPPAPAAPPPAAPPAPATPPAPAADEPKVYTEDYVKQLRRENADWRTKFQSASKAGADQFRALAQQLGIELPGGEPDPKKLEEEAARLRRENLELRVGSALGDAARKHGADAELLIPYLKGTEALGSLDPSAGTFAKDVSELVKGLLEKNPKLRGTQAVQRTTGDGPGGGSAAVEQLTQDQLKGMKPEEINAARLAGKLDKLLGR